MRMSGSVDRPLRDLLRGVQRLAIQGADEGSEITMPAQARPRSRPAHALCESTAYGGRATTPPRLSPKGPRTAETIVAPVKLARRWRTIASARGPAQRRAQRALALA